MCYDDNARPPIPPGVNGKARGEELVLTAADGTQFMAYAAHPEQPLGSQVIIYPDVRGLHQFYKELALRFGEAGISAVAIDYFGRTAGISSRDEPFEFMPHVMQMKPETFFQDATAAFKYLRQGDGVQRSTFTLGFCLGGSLSLLTGATGGPGLAGVVGFYAGMSRSFGEKGTVLDFANQISVPVLGLFGGDDPGIPVENVKLFDEKLDTTGIEHQVIIYDGAPHSFFDRKQADYTEQSADAWMRVLSFIETHSPAAKA
jgi:carboxymethylenebutenolidase